MVYLLMVNPNATFEELKSSIDVSMTVDLAYECIVDGGQEALMSVVLRLPGRPNWICCDD
jgi:hypothetical protein